MRTRVRAKPNKTPKVCYWVRVEGLFESQPVKILIHKANIVKETDCYYMLDTELNYSKRVGKAAAITELKPQLNKLLFSRLNSIERLEKEIEALQKEIDKLEEDDR